MSPYTLWPPLAQIFFENDARVRPARVPRAFSSIGTSALIASGRGWDHRNVIALVVLLVLLGLVLLGAIVVMICWCCHTARHRPRSTQSGDSRPSSPQTSETPAETQKKWYHRRKRRSSPRSSITASSEDVPLERVTSRLDLEASRNHSGNQTSVASATPAASELEDRPPAYQHARYLIQPQQAYLNPGQNSSHTTFNSANTAMTLPSYDRSYRDQIYEFQDAPVNTSGDSTYVPSYSRH
jgi:hypothetical protein